jgi:hypothetical protein
VRADVAALDVVVHAAGSVGKGGIEDLDLAEWHRVLNDNPRLPLESVETGSKLIPADGEPVELLADQIVSGEAHPLLATFGPGRFLA